MTKRTVFLDIDGTYANDHGVVPASASEAVRRARANGHLVFLATGRAKAMIPAYLTEAGFDGVIASGGGYAQVGGTVLHDVKFPQSSVRRALEYFTDHGIAYLLEDTAGLFGVEDTVTRLRRCLHEAKARTAPATTGGGVRERLQQGFDRLFDRLVLTDEPGGVEVNRMTFFDSPVPVDQVRAALAGLLEVIPGSVGAFGDVCGEVYLPGVTKAFGIEQVLAELGLPWESSIAFGDSHNDIEMLAYVHTGVTMAGAPEPVRAVADAHTAAPDEDGLAAGFRRLGLV